MASENVVDLNKVCAVGYINEKKRINIDTHLNAEKAKVKL